MSLAERIGLLSSTVVPSRKGPPTLKLGERHLLSAYDPVRDAERLAATIAGRVVLVGLGLGYLAEALGERLGEIIACEGEPERFAAARGMAAHERLPGKIGIIASSEELDRAIVHRSARGETILFDPAWEAAAAVKEELEALARQATTSPLVMVVLLRTAGDVIRGLASIQAYKRLQPHARIEYVVDRPYGDLARLATGIDRVVETEADQSESAGERPLLAFNFGGDKATALRAARMIAKRRPVFSCGYLERDGDLALHDDRIPARDAELNRYRNHMNRYHHYFAILGLPFSFDPPELRLGAPPIGAIHGAGGRAGASVLGRDRMSQEAEGTAWPPAAAPPIGAIHGAGGTAWPPAAAPSIELPAKPYRIVQLGAGSGAEVWAPKRLDPKAVGQALRRLGGVWFAVGAEYEADLATAAGIPDERNLCGRTTWDQLAHLLAGAECYIGNDSGPTHLAAALKIPTLALFGFTSPILNAPIGPTVLVIQADMPCAFKGCPIPCPERTCIATMTAEAIEAGMGLLLAERGSTEWWQAAAALRIAGLRPFLPGIPVEDPDSLAGALADESTIGAPRDPAAALLREWLATSER